MSFQATRAKRSARTVSWVTEAAPSNDQPDIIYAGLHGSSLCVTHNATSGRGLVATRLCDKGDTLLVHDPLIRVLGTSHASQRCHTCIAEAPTRTCPSCGFARYCDSACETAARIQHHEECLALQRWFQEWSPHEPGADVRALARLLWLRMRHASDWWRPIAAMQSNRQKMSASVRDEAATLAYRLARYIGSEQDLRALGLPSADALMELVCQHETNAFTLADAHLNPLGVCIEPTFALINHSCDPNAVIVFPDRVRGMPSKMHLVAIRPISAGEEVRTSYVDVASCQAERQATLLERYCFACECRLCKRMGWRDPRMALWCPQPKCTGWVVFQNAASSWTACTQCEQVPNYVDTRALDAAPALVRYVQQAMYAQDESATLPSSSIICDTLRQLCTQALPSHYSVWPLLYAAHTLAIEAHAWHDAVQWTMLLCVGMQAGERTSQNEISTALYPAGHPQRAVLLATLARLLCQDAVLGLDSLVRSVTRALAWPPIHLDAPDARGRLAQAALVQALQEAMVAFGKETGGGAIGAEIRESLGE